LGAVLSWEKGKFRPKEEKKVALVALRKLRKREVKKILAERGFSPEKQNFLPEINGNQRLTYSVKGCRFLSGIAVRIYFSILEF
jgi:hypothetical protein